METNIEQYLSNILQNMVLKSKTESFICHHGSRKDDKLVYNTYYDEYHGVWTTYQKARDSYILSKLTPIIEKITKKDL